MTEDTTPTDERAAFDLHSAIMNLPSPAEVEAWPQHRRIDYKTGHRDARHAAAELVCARASLAPSPAAGEAMRAAVALLWAAERVVAADRAQTLDTPMVDTLSHACSALRTALAAPPAPSQPAPATDVLRQCRDALAALLKRDERNTCQHEETHRGGVLWTICDSCGQQWADDEGGMPKWEDPPEWGKASAALAAADAALSQPAPAQAVPLTEEQIAEACGWKADMGCKPLPRELRIARATERAHGITGEPKHG